MTGALAIGRRRATATACGPHTMGLRRTGPCPVGLRYTRVLPTARTKGGQVMAFAHRMRAPLCLYRRLVCVRSALARRIGGRGMVVSAPKCVLSGRITRHRPGQSDHARQICALAQSVHVLRCGQTAHGVKHGPRDLRRGVNRAASRNVSVNATAAHAVIESAARPRAFSLQPAGTCQRAFLVRAYSAAASAPRALASKKSMQVRTARVWWRLGR